MKRRLSVLALMVAVILAVGLVNVPYAFGNEAEPAIEEPVEGVSEDGMVEEDPDEVTTDGLMDETGGNSLGDTGEAVPLQIGEEKKKELQGDEGSIWTTDADGKNHLNHFHNKEDVYIINSPAKKFVDGNYYVQVTDTSGKKCLGKSETAVVEVEGGKFVQAYQLVDILEATSGGPGFDDSDNGPYKVWISKDSSFPEHESKTDNFSVDKGYERLSITKSPSEQTVCSGETITFQVTVTNDGTRALKDIVIKDVFDATLLTNIQVTLDGQDITFTNITGGIEWELEDLAANQSKVYVVTCMAGQIGSETATTNKAQAFGKCNNKDCSGLETLPSIVDITILPSQAEPTGTLTIKKVITDATEDDKSVEFGVTVTDDVTPDGYNKTGKVTMNKDLVLSGLAFGTYQISETSIPDGYEFVSIESNQVIPTGYRLLNSNSLTVTLDEDVSETTVVVTNRKLGGLQVYKTFSFGNNQVSTQNTLLPSSVDIKITGPSYPEAGKIFTLNEGNGWRILEGNLEPGGYTITEENVDKNKWDVEIDSGGIVEVKAGASQIIEIINTYKNGEEPIGPKLVITKRPSKQTVNEGSIVTFTITVKNEGDESIEGITLEDVFDTRYLDIIQVKCGDEVVVLEESSEAGVESWSVGDLAPSDSRSYTVTFRAASVSRDVTTTNTVRAYYGDDYPPTDQADVTIRDTTRPPSDDDDDDDPKPKPKPKPEPEPEPEPEPPIIEVPREEPPVGVPVIPVEEEPVSKGDLPFTGGSELPAMLLGMGILAAGTWLRRRR